MYALASSDSALLFAAECSVTMAAPKSRTAGSAAFSRASSPSRASLRLATRITMATSGSENVGLSLLIEMQPARGTVMISARRKRMSLLRAKSDPPSRPRHRHGCQCRSDDQNQHHAVEKIRIQNQRDNGDQK